MAVPRVSIVAVLDDDSTTALRCLEAIAGQGVDPTFEVVVVDNATKTLSTLLARLDGDVRVIGCEHRLSLSAALRRGLEDAVADVVVLLREGSVPALDWLRRLVAGLDDPAIGMAASAGAIVDARSVAAARAHLLDLEWPDVADDHVLGALALASAHRGRRAVAVAGSQVAAASAGSPRMRASRPRSPVELTIVIPTLDARADSVHDCLSAIAACTDAVHEVIVIDNGHSPQGFSDPVNTGLRAADTPYVVVMNDDVTPHPGWWPPLRAALDGGAAVAFPHTVDGPMRTDFAAWCFAMTAASMRAFAHGPGTFFDPAMVIWFQDTDLLRRLCDADRPPVHVAASHIGHALSRTVGAPDPQLRAWIDRQVHRDEAAFRAKHPRVTLVPLQMAS